MRKLYISIYGWKKCPTLAVAEIFDRTSNSTNSGLYIWMQLTKNRHLNIQLDVRKFSNMCEINGKKSKKLEADVKLLVKLTGYIKYIWTEKLYFLYFYKCRTSNNAKTRTYREDQFHFLSLDASNDHIVSQPFLLTSSDQSAIRKNVGFQKFLRNKDP